MNTFKRIGAASALDKSKWTDFLINGGIFVLSAAVTYVTNNVASLDLGEYGLVIAPLIALGLKYVQKWIEKFQKEKVEPSPTPKPIDNNKDFDIVNR